MASWRDAAWVPPEFRRNKAHTDYLKQREKTTEQGSLQEQEFREGYEHPFNRDCFPSYRQIASTYLHDLEDDFLADDLIDRYQEGRFNRFKDEESYVSKVQDAKVGSWVLSKWVPGDDYTRGHWVVKCSLCQKKSDRELAFCPGCGAYMGDDG